MDPSSFRTEITHARSALLEPARWGALVIILSLLQGCEREAESMDNPARLGGTTPSPAAVEPGIVAPEPVGDFGELLEGEIRTHEFTLRNEGNRPFRIVGMRPECGCVVAQFQDSNGSVMTPEPGTRSQAVTLARLGPGEECRVLIELNTTNQGTGNLNKGALIDTDDPNHKEIRLTVRARLQRAFIVEPPAVQFGTLVRGETVTRQVIIRSAGAEDLELVDFENLPPYLKATRTRLTDEEGRPYYQVDLTLTEEAPVGLLAQTLTARLNHRLVKKLSFLAHATVKSHIRFDTKNSDNREFLDFGTPPAGTQAVQSVEIFNGEAAIPYSVKQVEVVSKHEEQLHAELITLREGQEYRVDVTWNVVAGTRLGGSKLRLHSDHPDLPLKEIMIQGWATKE
ncbi:MAG: DUF1573 domain-containing protein [Planctomycetota bacterium]